MSEEKATHSAEVHHAEIMQFKGQVNGHSLTMDADAQFGGGDAGPRPKPLLLVSLGGCTGMDVVSLLEKMRVEFSDLQIDVEGDLTDEHPKYYHAIRIHYQLKADEKDLPKIEKAINLSQDKYCGVSYMLAQLAEISVKISLK